MNRVHPLIRVGGPILGLLILIYAINTGVDTFRADLKSARDAEREATLAAAKADSEQEAEEETTDEGACPGRSRTRGDCSTGSFFPAADHSRDRTPHFCRQDGRSRRDG